VSSEPTWSWETTALVEHFPVACPAGVEHVTGGPPSEHWKIAEKAVVEKLLGFGEIEGFEQFDDKVPAKGAVVLGALNLW